MAVTERGALLALLRTSGRSWAQVTDDVEAAGSALAVLRAGTPGQLCLLQDDNDAAALAEAAEQEIIAWEKERMRFLSVLEPGLPGTTADRAPAATIPHDARRAESG